VPMRTARGHSVALRMYMAVNYLIG
jgi:hypothetical protein